MRAGADGLPIVARKRWGLGVRIEGPKVDLPVFNGMVAPAGGGMSVARDWAVLRKGFIPVQLGGENTTETMFALAEDDLPGDLNVRQEGPRKGHFVVEPRRMMPIEVYEALLAGTQGLWEPIGP